jgi:hypothetical protein
MKCEIELQRSDRILRRDRRYVALGTYLNGAVPARRFWSWNTVAEDWPGIADADVAVKID